MIDLPRAPHKKLSADQKAAWDKLVTLLSDTSEPDKMYDALPHSDGGKIISSDIARHLDARYLPSHERYYRKAAAHLDPCSA